jgi:ATP phosphoribosyltransferase regulatory subunit
LVPEIVEALARGGRYDGVGKAFGRDRAATGFSLELRSLAVASDAGPGQGTRPVAIRAPWADSAALRERIAGLRSQGEIVVQILPGHEQEQEEFACDRELVESNGKWVVRKL